MVWTLEAGAALGPNSRPKRVLRAGTHVVGRKDADILVEEKSVSRKHAILTVTPTSTAAGAAGFGGCTLSVQSVGQFGTTVTSPQDGKARVIADGVEHPLEEGSLLVFGNSKPYRVSCIHLVVCTVKSRMTTASMAAARNAGIDLRDQWDQACTHVMMPSSAHHEPDPEATAAALCAHLAGLPIVSEEWLLLAGTENKVVSELPDPAEYPADSKVEVKLSPGLLQRFYFLHPDGKGPTGYARAAVEMAGGHWQTPGSSHAGSIVPVQFTLSDDAGLLINDSWASQSRIMGAITRGTSEGMIQSSHLQLPDHTTVDAEPNAIRRAPSPLEDATPGPDGAKRLKTSASPAASPNHQCEAYKDRVKKQHDPERPPPIPVSQTGDSGATNEPGDVKLESHVKREGGRGSAVSDGTHTIVTCPLVVRPYAPLSNSVVQTQSGVAVLPNFKRFRKGRGTPSDGQRPMEPMETARWVQPVTQSHLQFLEDERSRLRTDRQADETFQASVKAVKAQPLPEPDSEDEQTAEPQRQKKVAKAAPQTGHDFDALVSSGKLSTLKVSELKAFLSSHKLPVGGKKLDLVERITSYLSS